MGDLVLTVPLIENLKRRFPAAEIDILAAPAFKELAEAIAGAGRVIVSGGAGDAFYLRRRGYDLAIDPVFTWKLGPALLCYMTGAPRRIGFYGGGREALFTATVDVDAHKGKGWVELNLELLKEAGIPTPVAVPKITPKDWVAKPAPLRIAMHTGGHYPSQRWPAQRFCELGRRLLSHPGVELSIIGSPSEKTGLEKLAAAAGAGCGVFTGGFRELIPFLAGCRLFIGNNSPPLHLAASLGVPTVSLMGPTDPRFMPAGEANTVLRKMTACSPCGKGRCSSHQCLEMITVEEVFAAVQGHIKEL
jgi:ADP-heptose:LPS heptosyltransferase